MSPTPLEVVVEPDRFEVVTEDVLLRATLQSAIAVCVFDSVDEAGALLHLRFVVREGKNVDVTDTTLATELLLLDRCVQTLRDAAPAARNLHARIAAHLPPASTARAACDSVLTLVGHFMSDIGAEVSPPDLALGAPRQLLFRPCMGLLQIR